MKKIFLTLCITTTIAGTLIYSFTVKPNKHINTKPAVANDSILNNTNNALVQKTEKPVIDNSTKKISTDSKKPLVASNITSNSNTSDNTASKASSKNQDAENNKSVTNTTPVSISTVSSSNTEDSSITKSNIDSSSSQNSTQTISTNNNNTNNNSSNNANNNSNITNGNATASKTNSSENNINATTIASSNFDSATYSKIQALAGPETAFVTNLNSYKVVNGVKYYNVYQYSINKDSNGWVYDGNYSNFIGARYMSTSGSSLNNQYVQDFSALTESQKKSTLYNLATEFTGYFPQYTGSISVDMNKTKDIDGYHCYLINWGNKSFYINLAGYIFVNKSQSFY